MKKITFCLISLLLFYLTIGCTKKETIVEPSSNRQLVLISDNDESSDLIIGILGSIRSNYPDVDVRYIQTNSFDIQAASYLLDIAVGDYPEGTIFAAIVEPGAASKKIVYKIGNKTILAADNGLSTMTLHQYQTDNIYYAENSQYIGGNWEKISYQTLYEQAILSILGGIEPSQFGPKCTSPVLFDVQDPLISGDTVKGEVLFTDNFGNCITNINDSLISGFTQGEILKIQSDSIQFFIKYGTTYASVSSGQNVCFLNSSLRLQLSIDYGSISDRYSLKAGSKIFITKGNPRIGILRYNQSTISTSIVNGMKAQLAADGFIENQNITYFEVNANGDQSQLPQLVSSLISQNIDIIVPVSTPAAQAAVQLVPVNIPIVFTYVTSPSSAGIIGKRAHVSGLSDATNFNDYLNFVKALLPNLSIAGRIYNYTESNSVYAQQQLLSLAPLYGLTLVSDSISTEGGLAAAYQLVKSQNVQAILIAADNTLNNVMTTLSALAVQDKLAVIGDSNDNAINGALASISVDYDVLSSATGDFVSSVILGQNPDNVPIQTFSTSVISLNQKTAQSIGYTFPSNILTKAKYIYQ